MTIYKVLLAILDFVPCILCFLAMLNLQKSLYHQMSKYSFAMLASGTVMILTAGTLKAFWKLFYYASNGAIDLFKLNQQFMPIQAFGFVFAFLGMLIMFIDIKRSNKKDVKLNAFIPLTFILILADVKEYVGKNDKDPGFVIYLVLLVLGTLGFLLSIAFIAFKKKKVCIGIIMVIVTFLMLGMGYLSTKVDGDNLWLNLTAELINTTAQSLFLYSVLILEKADISNIKSFLIKE